MTDDDPPDIEGAAEKLARLGRNLGYERKRLLLAAADSGVVPGSRDLERIADLELAGRAVEAEVETTTGA